jgi:hypothetical protein
MASKFRRDYSSNLTADVEEIVAVSEKRMTALMRQSLQDVINIMQEPVAKGGRMRVDTGFLRSSGQGSLFRLDGGIRAVSRNIRWFHGRRFAAMGANCCL